MEDQLELTAGMEDQLELAKQKKLTVLQECLAELKTLVDGCFILEFLCRYRTRRIIKVPEGDPIFRNDLIFYKVRKDLVLLENQIPFFVLEKLFRLIMDQIPNRLDNNWLLRNYVGWCYNEWMSSPLPNSDNSSRDCVLSVQSGNSDRRTAKYYHILHNLHEGCLPHDQTKQKHFGFRDQMPSASELVYAGVKFVPDTGNDLFKFKFNEPKGLFWWCRRARFEIPPLTIYDSTESYLRNLIALEQNCPGVSLHVSCYAGIMDTLVNTDKAIQVLEKAGVLRNCLGATEDATDLFNNLCKEIILGNYFRDTRSEATEYSKRFWPKNMAYVSRMYLASPWTFIAFSVGFIAFVISLVGFVRDFIKKG